MGEIIKSNGDWKKNIKDSNIQIVKDQRIPHDKGYIHKIELNDGRVFTRLVETLENGKIKFNEWK